MRIAVIGLGYVGSTVVGAAVGTGHEVYAYDLDETKIQKIQELILSENYDTDAYLYITLREYIHNAHFSNIYDDNLRNSPVKIICVDTINIISAVQMIAPFVQDGDVVIIESTTPLSTVSLIKEIVEKSFSAKDYIFAFVPERVMEGRLLQKFEEMPRPIGVENKKQFKVVKKIYENLGVKGKLQYTDSRHASASKDIENAYRMVEISIANEFADICRENNLDFAKIRNLVNAKGHEMGYNELLNSGIGIGGPCIPMAADIVAKMDWDNANLLRTAIEMNLGRPVSIAETIYKLLIKRLGKVEEFDDINIGIFGTTYRANGVDIRESPAIEVIKNLSSMIDAEYLYIYDPLYPNPNGVVAAEKPEIKLEAVVVLVGHDAFRDLSDIDCDYFIDLTGVVKKYPEGARRIKLQV